MTSFTHCKVFRDHWKPKIAGCYISNCLKSSYIWPGGSQSKWNVKDVLVGN